MKLIDIDIDSMIRDIAAAQGREIVAQLVEWIEKGNCVVVPEYLSTKQAAAFTGFTANVFEHHRARGEGPRASKIGQQYRYNINDLRAWMESHRTDSGDKQ